MHAAVFIDRDNTLIANDGDLGDPDKVSLIDGVAGGLRALRDAGYYLVVVTNQGGVARGKYTESDVDAVHQRIASMLDEAAGHPNLIDRFYYCPYHPQGTVTEYRRDHPWRKPHPGMLLQAAHDMGLKLDDCWMIGDAKRDIMAGRSVGCRTVLIAANGELARRARPTAAVRSFGEAVQLIVGQRRRRGDAPSAPPADDEAGPQSPEPEPVAAEPKGPDDALQRSIRDLTEEMRAERLRRTEFTPLVMTALFCQLLVLLMALLGLLQISDLEMFTKWMLGAVLLQLMTIAVLILDSR